MSNKKNSVILVKALNINIWDTAYEGCTAKSVPQNESKETLLSNFAYWQKNNQFDITLGKQKKKHIEITQIIDG